MKLVLRDGDELRVALEQFPRLAAATKEDLEGYRSGLGGDSLHWDRLDEDLSLEGLIGRHSVAQPGQNVREVIAPRLRAARLKAGLSIAELADRIGLAQSTVQLSEKGQIPVQRYYEECVLNACRLPSDWQSDSIFGD